MSSITVPIGHIEVDDTQAPELWLQKVIDQAEYVLDNWQPDWHRNIGHDASMARTHAEKALQALSQDDIAEGMLAAFRAGRFLEKAVRELAVHGVLKYKKVYVEVQKQRDDAAHVPRDNPLQRKIRREVNLLDNLSFLEEKSWKKRAEKLKEITDLQASNKYITDTLKEMPRVQEYLSNTSK